MQQYINKTVGALEEDMHFVYVGCEDVPHFGYEVENGLQVDVAKAEPGILAKVKQALAEKPAVKAVLLECTELPPYASAIRAATGLPDPESHQRYLRGHWHYVRYCCLPAETRRPGAGCQLR